jgi:hypothetical protein
MSCHACQESEEAALQACGHRLCAGCLVVLGDKCINERCVDNGVLLFRLPTEEWEKIGDAYQGEIIEQEAVSIAKIDKLTREYEAKVAALRKKCERKITKIAHHSKIITASLMREQSLIESPSCGELTDLPAPILIRASECLTDIRSYGDNKFRDGSHVSCKIFRGGFSGMFYNFKTHKKGHRSSTIGDLWCEQWRFRKKVRDSASCSGLDAFDQEALILYGYNEDIDALLFEENVKDGGSFIMINKRSLPKRYQSPSMIPSIESFTLVSKPLFVNHRLCRVTVGQDREQVKDFLIFFDLPYEAPKAVAIRRYPKGLMITFDYEHTIKIRL